MIEAMLHRTEGCQSNASHTQHLLLTGGLEML